jgi:hypothetical protein
MVMQNLIEDLKTYFNNTPQTKINEDWAKYEQYDNMGPKVSDLLAHFETHFPYIENFDLERQIQTEKLKNEEPESIGLFLCTLVP